MKNFILILLLLVGSSLTKTVNASTTAKDPLSFMVPCNLEKAKEYAKHDRKPILIYIHSTKCAASRKFTREIVGKGEFAKWADKNFIAMEANVLSTKGKAIAKKYGVVKIPSIVMLSFDNDMEYLMDLKLDSVSLYNQFRSFLSANSLKSQIELLRETNGLSYTDASIAIAKSYAKKDFKKNPGASVEMLAAERTLKIVNLKELHEAYISEFKTLTANAVSEKSKVAKN